MKEKLEVMKGMAKMALFAMGANITMPKKLWGKVLKLNPRNKKKFHSIVNELAEMPTEDKEEVVKALTLTQCKVATLMELPDELHDAAIEIVEYVGENPEVREQTSFEEAIKHIAGSDFDIDKID